MSALDRARRLAEGDRRSYTERVADALTGLADVIEEERHPGERLRAYADALGFVRSRARDDFLRTTGREP
jgi:hypothetical protein